MHNFMLGDMWNQAEMWRIIAAAVSGIIVGIIYFYSLRWSINHMNERAHKMRFFILVALCRMSLFFGVLYLIGNRNIAVISVYVLAFFLTKVMVVLREKGRFLEDKNNVGGGK